MVSATWRAGVEDAKVAVTALLGSKQIVGEGREHVSLWDGWVPDVVSGWMIIPCHAGWSALQIEAAA